MTGFGGKVKGSGSHQTASAIREALGHRTIVLVGLMGCGKSSVGRRLAMRLGLPFVDADEEIELAAGQTIAEVFAHYGEDHFRDREWRVISRILDGGPQVLATGGGAYMRAETREKIARCGIAVWLKADLSVLMQRVMRRNDRPLLRTPDPKATMRALMEERYPVYAQADVIIDSRDVPHDVIVGEIVAALSRRLCAGRAEDRTCPAGPVSGPHEG